MAKPKLAIACQGGGSQTAFTAGVLKSFFQNNVHRKKEIVGFSGTSGGAVCAALSWYSLLKSAANDNTPVEERLIEFWKANSTSNVIEEVMNNIAVSVEQLIDHGLLPEWKASPGSPIRQAMQTTYEIIFPKFYNFRRLLQEHMNFDEIPQLVKSKSPVLLIGAANVLTGEFKKFSSLKNEIQVESILASAALPSIFPAVQIGDAAYWDGLFSDNPPIDALADTDYVGKERVPDEIWVIQINPLSCKKIPETPQDILDRRNEMIGNDSLLQGIQHIDRINKLLKRGAFSEEYITDHNLKQIDVYIITMSKDLLDTLDYASKLDRDSSFIEKLLEDGVRQGELFLKNPKSMQHVVKK